MKLCKEFLYKRGIGLKLVSSRGKNILLDVLKFKTQDTNMISVVSSMGLYSYHLVRLAFILVHLELVFIVKHCKSLFYVEVNSLSWVFLKHNSISQQSLSSF